MQESTRKQHVTTVLKKFPQVDKLSKIDIRKELLRLVDEFDYCVWNMKNLDIFYEKIEPKTLQDLLYLQKLYHEFRNMLNEDDERVNRSLLGNFINSVIYPYKDFIT